MKFVNCNQADTLQAGEVYRVTFIQTAGEKVGAFLFSNFSPSQEFLSVYQRITDEQLSPYGYPVSQPPAADSAAVIDVKIRIQEFHAGTVGDLGTSLDQLSDYLTVDQVERPSRTDLGTQNRATALGTATQQGQQQAQDTGIVASINRILGSLKTVVIVVAVGAAIVAGAYLVKEGKSVVGKVKP
jgi:hypothetical protein